MTKYKKKPVIIEAIQFKGIDDYLKIVRDYKDNNTTTLSSEEMFEYRTPVMLINTLEGTMVANVGDYVIKGVCGEFYPCKEDIFKMTYEEVGE